MSRRKDNCRSLVTQGISPRACTCAPRLADAVGALSLSLSRWRCRVGPAARFLRPRLHGCWRSNEKTTKRAHPHEYSNRPVRVGPGPRLHAMPPRIGTPTRTLTAETVHNYVSGCAPAVRARPLSLATRQYRPGCRCPPEQIYKFSPVDIIIRTYIITASERSLICAGLVINCPVRRRGRHRAFPVGIGSTVGATHACRSRHATPRNRRARVAGRVCVPDDARA